MIRRALYVALALTLLAPTTPVLAQECCTGQPVESLPSPVFVPVVSPQVTYRLEYQTLYEPQEVTTCRVEYETQYEERNVTTFRPVWETQIARRPLPSCAPGHRDQRA